MRLENFLLKEHFSSNATKRKLEELIQKEESPKIKMGEPNL